MSASPANSPMLFLVANEMPPAAVRRRGEGEDAAPFAALFATALGDEAATVSGQGEPDDAVLAAPLPGDEQPHEAVIADDSAITELPVAIEPGAIIDTALSAQRAANAAAAKPAVRAIAATPAGAGERATPATPATPAMPPAVALAQRSEHAGGEHLPPRDGEWPRPTTATPATPAIPAQRSDAAEDDSGTVRAQPAIPAIPASESRAATTAPATPTDGNPSPAPAIISTADAPLAPATPEPGTANGQPRGLARAVYAGAQPQTESRPAVPDALPSRSDGNPSHPDKNPDIPTAGVRNPQAAAPTVPATPAQPGEARAQPAQAAVPSDRFAAEPQLREPARPAPLARGARAADAGAAILARGVLSEPLRHRRAPAPDELTAPSMTATAPNHPASNASSTTAATPAPPTTAPVASADITAARASLPANDSRPLPLPPTPTQRAAGTPAATEPGPAQGIAHRDADAAAAARPHAVPNGSPAMPSVLANTATSTAAAALDAAPVAVASARHAEHVERNRNTAPGRRDAAAMRSTPANAPARTTAIADEGASERADAATDLIETGLGVEHSVPEPSAAPSAHWTGASLARFQGLPPTAQLPAFGLSTPRPDSPDFPEVIGERLQWLVDRRIGHAEIRVVPPDLGVIEVKLQVEGDQVKVEFHSPSSEVRQALEAGLPRLRELLDAQGLTLTQSDIGKQTRERGQDAQAGGERPAGEQPGATPGKPGHEPARARKGLLDEYA